MEFGGVINRVRVLHWSHRLAILTFKWIFRADLTFESCCTVSLGCLELSAKSGDSRSLLRNKQLAWWVAPLGLTPLTGLILAERRWEIPSGSMVGWDELVHGSQRSATARWIISAAERFRKVTGRIPGRWAAERTAPGHSLVLLTSEYFLTIDYESRAQALSLPPICSSDNNLHSDPYWLYTKHAHVPLRNGLVWLRLGSRCSFFLPGLRWKGVFRCY